MKIIKTLLILCLLTGSRAVANPILKSTFYSEIPAKTICIKHPDASNPDKYFSTSTNVMFEVYKAGSKDEISKIIGILKSDSNVESATEGRLTGDYQAITISLKNTKDKAWFVALFKKAGLNTIRINNNPIVSVEKM